MAPTTTVVTKIFFAFFLVTGDMSFPMFAIATNAWLSACTPGTAAIAPVTGVSTTGTAISGELNDVPPGCPINVATVVIASGGIGRPEPGGGAGGVSLPSSPTTCGALFVPKNSMPPFSTPGLSSWTCGTRTSAGATLGVVSDNEFGLSGMRFGNVVLGATGVSTGVGVGVGVGLVEG